ncbi:hypothetical protein OVA24_10325 [Luteolibacter sp. SL250]|uniref:hypothetical protein n=1 Tax=Luteolibacter sp. SL250 TaxID=2995170 RepID=UPI0022713693|nr:hypothetical protein [Luteolibacter sp. SL250]WAC21781.1 hypothetical protein OVA24_10325 [Luteolibacter sp. SL250]
MLGGNVTILPEIDIDYLIKQVPNLSSVRFRHYSWERLGSRIAAELLDPSSGGNTGARAWQRTRWEMFRLIGTCDSIHSETRTRLTNAPPRSTGELVAQLALWLSGVVGIPLSVAASLVSIALFAIAEESVHELLPSDSELVG